MKILNSVDGNFLIQCSFKQIIQISTKKILLTKMEEQMNFNYCVLPKVQYLLITILFFLTSPALFAAGFQISEQSGTGLGRAFAGFGIINDDLSMAFYNPAGLTQKKGMQIQASGYLIDGKSRFDADAGANNTVFGGGALVIPNTGEDDDGAKFAVVPNLYFTMDLTDRIKYGFSITAPFGLATDYDRDWVGRYQAKESELKTININPSLAYRVNDSFSVGAGLVAEYAEATLSQALSNGPGMPDGFSEVKGEDWSYGWTFGVMYHPDPTFRAGIGFRSKISHKLDGDDNDITGVAALGGNFSADVEARATLPETIHAGIYKELSPKWGLSLGFRWTRWNRLQEVIIKTEGLPDNVLELKWDNVYSANIGIDYFHSDKWTFRAGYMFDESPTNDEFRTPRIPDEDRNWLAIGASYHPNDQLQLDFGFTHILIDDADVNLTTPIAGGAGVSNLVGEYKDPNVNILSLQAVYKF